MTTLAEHLTVIPIVTTEQLLRRRDALPAGDPGRLPLRTRAIEMNLSLAARLARRYAGRGEALDDLVQVATLALIKVVDAYDPERQVPFVGYAYPYILGALKRHFRDAAWGMRVPRPAQELSRHLSLAAGELSQLHSRTPTQAEIAKHLNVSAHDLQVAVGAAQVYQLASLDAPHPGTETSDLNDFIGDVDPGYGRVDDHVSLQPLLAALPLRERRILSMRFDGQMTQTHIAAEVGLSQMHVSRILKQSLAQLRAGLPA